MRVLRSLPLPPTSLGWLDIITPPSERGGYFAHFATAFPSSSPSLRSLPLTYSAEFVSSGDCVKRFRPHSGTPVAKETTKSGGGTDRVCMRRRSRTLPWGRSAPRPYLGEVVVAPSLHSRSVSTDLIKTSRSSTRSPVQATAAALHLMGHFYLNACRINVFEAPPAPTPSSLSSSVNGNMRSSGSWPPSERAVLSASPRWSSGDTSSTLVAAAAAA